MVLSLFFQHLSLANIFSWGVRCVLTTAFAIMYCRLLLRVTGIDWKKSTARSPYSIHQLLKVKPGCDVSQASPKTNVDLAGSLYIVQRVWSSPTFPSINRRPSSINTNRHYTMERNYDNSSRYKSWITQKCPISTSSPMGDTVSEQRDPAPVGSLPYEHQQYNDSVPTPTPQNNTATEFSPTLMSALRELVALINTGNTHEEPTGNDGVMDGGSTEEPSTSSTSPQIFGTPLHKQSKEQFIKGSPVLQLPDLDQRRDFANWIRMTHMSPKSDDTKNENRTNPEEKKTNDQNKKDVEVIIPEPSSVDVAVEEEVVRQNRIGETGYQDKLEDKNTTDSNEPSRDRILLHHVVQFKFLQRYIDHKKQMIPESVPQSLHNYVNSSISTIWGIADGALLTGGNKTNQEISRIYENANKETRLVLEGAMEYNRKEIPDAIHRFLIESNVPVDMETEIMYNDAIQRFNGTSNTSIEEKTIETKRNGIPSPLSPSCKSDSCKTYKEVAGSLLNANAPIFSPSVVKLQSDAPPFIPNAMQGCSEVVSPYSDPRGTSCPAPPPPNSKRTHKKSRKNMKK